jgi:hypothetical protein
VVYAARGPLLRAVCCCDNPRHISAIAQGSLSMDGYRLGRGWLNTRIESSLRRRCWVRKCLFENPPYRVFPAAVDQVDHPSQIMSLFRLRPFTGMCSFSPCPQGRLETHTDGRQLLTALSLRCIPAGRRRLQRPPPSHVHMYPPRRHKTHHIQIPPVDMSACEEYFASKRNFGLAKWGILTH